MRRTLLFDAEMCQVTAWHPFHSPPPCQMINPPEAEQPPHHAGPATLSARHRYPRAALPGCNL